MLNGGRSTPKIDSILGPGAYNEHRTFGKGINRGHMGVRRDEKIPESIGPGYYSHERADSLTKPTPQVNQMKDMDCNGQVPNFS